MTYRYHHHFLFPFPNHYSHPLHFKRHQHLHLQNRSFYLAQYYFPLFRWSCYFIQHFVFCPSSSYSSFSNFCHPFYRRYLLLLVLEQPHSPALTPLYFHRQRHLIAVLQFQRHSLLPSPPPQLIFPIPFLLQPPQLSHQPNLQPVQ